MTARASDQTVGLWTLSKGSSSGTSSAGPSNSSSSSDEDDGVYIVVNGKRAQSMRTGKAYGQVSAIKRKNDLFEMTTSDGKSVRMSVGSLDTEALGQELGIEQLDTSLLEESLQPLLHSTPYQIRGLQMRKRMRTMGNPASLDDKYKGCIDVPLSRVKKAQKGFSLIEGNPTKVEAFKAELVTNPHHHVPVLPVMVEEWDGQDQADNTDYMLLGGYSLWEAITDLADDDKFSHYRRCLVKVYAGLSQIEALQIGAAFQQHQTLMRDEVPDLEAKVQMCRHLLYKMHDLDEDSDAEPPSVVQEEWRRQCAAALGCVGTKCSDRKPLEATFQLALYSRRCYIKLGRLFSIQLEKTGKSLKQTIFLQLQGLKEDDRFSLLTQLVNGEIEISDVKEEALKIKRLTIIRRTFMTLTRQKSWQECVQKYATHTQDSSLAQFLSKDMRKAVPQEFVDFITEAEDTLEGSCTSVEQLRTSPVALTVLDVQSTKRMKRTMLNLKDGTAQVAILADTIAVAAAWQAEIQKQGFNVLAEAAVISESNVRHLIVGGRQQDSERHPKVIQQASFYRTLLECFTEANDEIAYVVKDQDALDDEARSMQRVCRKLWGFTEDSQNNSLQSSSDEYDFVA